jgi:signal transduction histidine kinase
MGENEYKAAIQKQGVHGFILVMSTDAMRLRCRQDVWLRGVIGVLSIGSVLGFGLAWRSLTRSSELEVRLVRAAELNARLKEMNLAAAGLAHETRNPLNIIRGLAQMISRQPEASPEVRQKSKEIIDETDRVTAQLTEFINFFRPREVRRGAVDLAAVAADVIRTLGSDLEEKGLRPKVTADLPAVEADEAMLRQALFNLLLNSVQAVGAGGDIQIVAERAGPNEARIDVRDNGPGVLPEHRTEIFKPYFTTHEEGTGLGLAVVQQIVLAHGWEIVCLPNEPRGAVFRILHVRLAAGAPSGNP